jgi:acetolactate synthase-1/2/3 large subunit
LKVATIVAQTIAASGSQFAFGHPGGEVVILIDELQKAGIPFYLTHHENTAAFMALGYGEVTGIPGICVSTLGPGATNMATGVASALLERAPVLALTGALAAGAPRGTTHQKLDLNAFYEPITKASVAVEAATAGRAIVDALRLTTAERPGPVHLSIPSDVAGREGTLAPAAIRRPVPATGGSPDRGQKALARARRPAVIVGLSALRPGVVEALAELVARTGAPVAVTPKAKGIIRETDPHFLGTIEMAGDDIIVDFLGKADLILAIGVDVVELDKPWRMSAPVVNVDVLPERDGYYPSEAEIVGPIDAGLRALADVAVRSDWSLDEIAAMRSGLETHVCPISKRLQPWEIIDAVRDSVPPSTIATSDVGAHKMLVGQRWRAPGPRSFFMANGLSSMGYAIPVAAAARLARPSTPAVAFVGDGGFAMYLGELETLVRLGLDLTIVVFLDNSLELIKRSQHRRKIPVEGTTFANPDLEKLVGSFGGHGYLVTTRKELSGALVQARQPGINVIGAVIDGADYRL